MIFKIPVNEEKKAIADMMKKSAPTNKEILIMIEKNRQLLLKILDKLGD